MKKLGPRCAAVLKKIVIQYNNNEELFKQKIDEKIDHYCGNHNKCNPEFKTQCDSLLVMKDSKGITEFMVY